MSIRAKKFHAFLVFLALSGLHNSAIAISSNFDKNGGFEGLWQGVNPVNGAVETASIVRLNNGRLAFTYTTPSSDICAGETGNESSSSVSLGNGFVGPKGNLVINRFTIYCGPTTDPNTPTFMLESIVVLVDRKSDVIFSTGGGIFDPRSDIALHRISAPAKQRFRRDRR